MSKYFAYDPECGFELFDTADEAQSHAQDAIDQFREEAAEGWPESVEGVCWGELKQHAVETTLNAGDKEDIDKEFSDYILEDPE
ncbi:hypothetical protein QNA27_08900 [Pantoea eucalypti]|uniref:hypothetical protein n=1 Tax=Pantoea eucalypti TaxID=470933 RepID=UPI0024BAAE29|nr:hypothetical protein [Pantoea eucalypti]MDJ0473767.1 hypothetical protein [Pantoea eucalypti]